MGPLGHDVRLIGIPRGGEVTFIPMKVTVAPLVAANDPLPAETIAAATLLCHRTGDFLMRASALSGALERPDALARSEVHLATMRAELALLIRVFEQVDGSLATLRGLAERAARIQAMQGSEGGVS